MMPRCHPCDRLWISGDRKLDLMVAGCASFSCDEHRGKQLFDIDGYWAELARLYDVTPRSVRVEIHGEAHVAWEEALVDNLTQGRQCPCAKCATRREVDAAPKPPMAPPKRTRRGHVQGEAFLVMRYEGKGGVREWIWNSRDGITPFMVESVDGKTELQHGNWHLDRYEPLHVPAVGSRVFVDFTEEIARPLAIEYVERGWERDDYPMCVHPEFAAAGKDGTVEIFVRKWVSDWGGHAPHLAVVTPAMHEQFKARADGGRSPGGMPV